MVRYFFITILIVQGLSSRAQFTAIIQWQPVQANSNADTIYYSPARKLVWADFKGKPVTSSFAAAITESGFGYRLSMNSSGNKTIVVVTVFCYFNKKKSWVKKDMDNDYALLHEQHHYDITYINTCLFIQKLREAQLNRGNFSYLVDKIYDECYTALNQMQDEYDGQTSNGRISRMQVAWNKKIDKLLTEIPTN